MVLLYIQKACTAFHELEPAWKQGALKQEQVDFFSQRLAKRLARRRPGLDYLEKQ